MPTDEQKIVQIIFLGNPSQGPRLKYLLKEKIPHKVIFISAEENESNETIRSTVEDMRNEMEKMLPEWVRENSEHVTIPFFDFPEALTALVEIMERESLDGRHVVINVHGSSILASTAALTAANITGAEMYWIEPDDWELHEEDCPGTYIPQGASRARRLDLPIGLALPDEPHQNVLSYVASNNGLVRSNLENMSKEIGKTNLGPNITKTSSAIYKLSKTLSDLRDEGLVKTRRSGRRSYEVQLTEKGEVLGKISTILRDD